MAYLLLLLTILTDLVATWWLKLSNGLTRGVFVALAIAAYLASKALFGLTLARMSLGYAYTLWCGVGTLLACLISQFELQEPLGTLSWVGVGVIIAGIALVELGSR